MKKSVILSMFIALVMFAACGSDDSTTDEKDTAVQQDTTAEPEVEADNAVEPDLPAWEDTGDEELVGEDVPVVGGACTNESDKAILDADRDGITAKAKSCGMGCLNDADKIACSVPCITAEYALTDECAGCYAGTIVCTVDRCLVECLADASAPACVECQETKGCLPEFYECSGLDPEA